MRKRIAYLRCFGCLFLCRFCLLRGLCCGWSSYYSLSEVSSETGDSSMVEIQQHPQEQLLRLPGRPAWKLAFDPLATGVVLGKS